MVGVLKLNVGKCEVVMFSDCSMDVPECVGDGSVLPARDIGGFWWKGDLLAST